MLGDAVSGFFSGPRDRLAGLLLVVCLLVWLAYLALRYSRRLQIPVVTAFLLLGIALGPSGLDLVNSSMMSSLRIVEPVALGMIAFAAGEQLRLADLASLSRRNHWAIALETLLPVVAVALGVYFVTGRIAVALPIGAVAGTTGLATVISTLKESGAKGAFTRVLGAAVATDNIFAVLLFSLTLPLVVAVDENGSAGTLYLEGLLNIVASIAIGSVAGVFVSRSVKGVRSSNELSMFALAYVLLVVGITEYLQFSVLLAGLAMGAVAANLTADQRDRGRVFAALGPLEYPVFSIFFLWAGASLHVRALGSVGLVFGIYLVGRAAGKLAGPFFASLGLRWSSAQAVQFRSLGVGLLPQAGAAVGLAVIARDSLPQHGDEVLATILAAVVVFELVGPLGVLWAARKAGEVAEWSSIQPLTLEEAVRELESRRARVVVAWDHSGPPPVMDAPREMAARLQGDLVELAVGFGPSSQESPQGMLQLDPHNVDRFFEVMSELKPDVLFVSPTKKLRQALGAAESLAERVGSPVFELSTAGGSKWVSAVSATLTVADERMTKISRRWREDWQPRLAARRNDRDKET